MRKSNSGRKFTRKKSQRSIGIIKYKTKKKLEEFDDLDKRATHLREEIDMEELNKMTADENQEDVVQNLDKHQQHIKTFNPEAADMLGVNTRQER